MKMYFLCDRRKIIIELIDESLQKCSVLNIKVYLRFALENNVKILRYIFVLDQ